MSLGDTSSFDSKAELWHKNDKTTTLNKQVQRLDHPNKYHMDSKDGRK